MSQQDNKLLILKLREIELSKTNPRQIMDQTELLDLIASIKQKGVLQPILVRPISGSKKFELVCGERRFKAAKEAGLKEIPANIRYLTDDEAFEIQIIENLERKDVHPLDESDAFKKMLDSKKYTIDDIAAKVVKTTSFITQRLKLRQLIPKIKKDFRAGHLGIGQAILLARSSKEVQNEIHKSASAHYLGDKKNPVYASVRTLKNEIERHNPEMKKAVFNLNDKTLNRRAGACADCPKRTIANPLLFPDMGAEDKCTDRKCFDGKTEAHLKRRVQQAIEEGEKIIFVQDYYESAPADVIKLITDHKIKIFKEYDDVQFHKSEYSGFTKKAKGIKLGGTNKGRIDDVWLKESSSDKGAAASPGDEIDDQLAKMKVRADRALELDNEKIWSKVKELDVDKFVNNDKSLKTIEKIALLVAINTVAWRIDDPFLSNLNVGKVYDGFFDSKAFNRVIRKFINDKLRDNISHAQQESAAALMLVLQEYYAKDIDEIEKAQFEATNKRISNYNKRVEALKRKKDKLQGGVEAKPQLKKV